jgi:hypothetical protein
MNCPTCQGTLIYDQERRAWKCEPCKTLFNENDPRLIRSLLSRLPYPLALVLKEYIDEPHPYVKLHRLFNAAEMAVRFLATIALREVEREKGIRHSSVELRGSILRGIERPKFGNWVELLRSSVNEIPNEQHLLFKEIPSVATSLLDLVEGTDARDKREGTSQSVQSNIEPVAGKRQGLVAMRNHAIHVRMTPEESTAYLEDAGPRFQRFWSDAASKFDRMELIAVGSDQLCHLLRSLPIEGSRFAKVEATYFARNQVPEPGAIVLFHVDHKIWMNLSPMQYFGPILRRPDDGSSEPVRRTQEDVLQVYARREDHRLQYTALHDSCGSSDGGQLLQQQFEALFPTRDWQEEDRRSEDARIEDALKKGATKEAIEDAKQFRFRDIVTALEKELFIGRKDQIEELLKWLKQCQGGVGVVHGAPGMGKTALIARLSIEIMRRQRNWICLRHFFKSDDGERCSVRGFIRGVLAQLCEKGGELVKIGSGSDMDQTHQVFRDALRRFSTEKLGKGTEAQKEKLVLLLDGLDEIAEIDGSIFKLIRETQIPGVVWLASGRALEPVEEGLPDDGVNQWIFKSGLPPLDRASVRAFLLNELKGDDALFLLRDERGENRFLDELASETRSLPLYLKLLVEELRDPSNAKKYMENPSELPKGLVEYYDRLVNSFSLDDAKQLLPQIIALLAHTKTAIPESTLTNWLSDPEVAYPEESQRVVSKALRMGHILLRVGHVRGEMSGYSLYHQSFRDYLLERESWDGGFRFTVSLRKAQKLINQVCQKWRGRAWADDKSYEREYAIRYVTDHAADAYEMAIATLKNAKVEHQGWARQWLTRAQEAQMVLAKDDDLIKARLGCNAGSMHGDWLCKLFEGKERDEREQFSRDFCRRWGAETYRFKITESHTAGQREALIKEQKELITLLVNASLPGCANEAERLCVEINKESGEPEFLRKAAWIWYQALDKWEEAENRLREYLTDIDKRFKTLKSEGKEAEALRTKLDHARGRAYLAHILFDSSEEDATESRSNSNDEDPESILKDCLPVFKEFGQRTDEANALEAIAIMIDAEGRWDDQNIDGATSPGAVSFYSEAEKIYKMERDGLAIGRLYLNRSIAYLFSKGVKAANAEMKLSQKHHKNYGSAQLRYYWDVNNTMLELLMSEKGANYEALKRRHFDEEWLDLTFQETWAVSLSFAGDCDGAVAEMVQLMGRFKKLKDSWGEVDNQINAGLVFLSQERWDDALTYLRPAYEQSDKIDYPVGCAMAAYGLKACGERFQEKHLIQKEHLTFYANHLEHLFDICKTPFVPCYTLLFP